MSRSSRRRRARPMAATRSRASPIWIATARPMRRPAGGARSSAQADGRGDAQRGGSGGFGGAARRGPLQIEGELVAQVERGRRAFAKGARVFHLKVRLWHGGGGRRQQADGRFRQGRPQDGAGELCAGGVGNRRRGEALGSLALESSPLSRGAAKWAPRRVRSGTPAHALALRDSPARFPRSVGKAFLQLAPRVSRRRVPAKFSMRPRDPAPAP